MSTSPFEQISLSPTPPLPSPPPPVLPPAWHPRSREPIRGESRSLETLDAQARLLADACRLAPRGAAEQPLLPQLARNGRLLVDAYRRIAAAAGRQVPLTPDAEWLLDNFYIVEGVLREVRRDMPRGYYQKLPKLADSPLAGYPRVYALAVSLLAHTDSNLDEAHITRFVQAFQTVAPLSIGELWAVPIMLRLALLENLSRMAEHMLQVWGERRRAELWVEPLVRADGADPGDPRPALAHTPAHPGDAFVVRALQVLRQEGRPAAVEQVEAYLARRGLDVQALLRRENQRQAVSQVSVGNCMTSLRLLSALDWNVFFERTNLVEPLLRQDPAGAYAQQDFASRDRYRQVVEKLARGSDVEEVEVARRLLRRAAGEQPPRNHVGYYLIGPGKAAFQAELGYRPDLGTHLLNGVLDHPRGVYFGSIAGFLILFLVLLLLGGLAATGTDNPWVWTLTALAALVPLSELAVGLVNYLLTLVLSPRTLPKLEFKEGTPADCATFVVIPSMLVRPDSAAALAERLESHYLANPDPQLRFALLTDFADAPAEHLPEDEGHVRDALERIAALNRRYAAHGPPRFFLFHRKRQWDPSEGCWMGWERKRGKLEEFNRLLRGDPNTSYTVQSSPPPCPPHRGGGEEGVLIRYVITLDTDTEMPHETARRLVGTLAHPLNRARFDPAQGRVVEGYAILQPRISFHVLAAHRSRFTRIMTGSAGLDPYATAVSDIYQDLFGVGSFTGKGIYEVDAFHDALGHTFPDNHILSHDLIEGNYARCGLATDIELFDDFPVRYPVYARRQHRWIRGDWQLLSWLGRKVPAPAEGPSPTAACGLASAPDGTGRTLSRKRPNPLPLVERWKIFDNLRRSLVPPALVLWLVLSWTVLPVPLGLSAGLALVVLALPLLLQMFGTLIHTVKDRSPIAMRDFMRNGWKTGAGALLNAVVLLKEAYLCTDAIVRTLVRLWLTRRHLLEWETAASTDRRLGASFPVFWKTMWPATALAAGLGVLVLLTRPEAVAAAGGFLVAWFLSPLVAWWISQGLPVRQKPLSPAEQRELHLIARKTWGFFESFVGAEDHWLPPDNYQEEPRPQVAHRTSPTNQGLLLIATLAAHDFGYLRLGCLLDRLEKTFNTFDRLERYQGHFYNWYDTRTLQALPPTYVSTVDSGNLAASLITLAQGLREKMDEPILGPLVAHGLADTFGVLLSITERPECTLPMAEKQAFHSAFSALTSAFPSDLPGWAKWLDDVKTGTAVVGAAVQRLAESDDPFAEDLDLWTRRLTAQVEKRAAEVAELAPWMGLLADSRADKAAKSLGQGDAETAQRWQTVWAKLAGVFSPAEYEAAAQTLPAELDILAEKAGEEETVADWLRQVRDLVRQSAAGPTGARCRRLADRAAEMAAGMDFRFLYKPDRHLFAIGFNASQGHLDAACYDLLASEARLASYLAIARGDVPRRHWFHLGRAVVRAAGDLCLVSWGGTMFEYLMPRLFLRRYPDTLLEESCTAAVAAQMAYGREHRVPWGISESAFSSQYVSFDYQYQTFGVPELGLKRGLAQDQVVAPYATALASIMRPHDALANFRRLAAEGASGRYGFYESIDYTRSRLPERHRSLVVRCFMAHHQGMSLTALANCLLGAPMVRRFHAEPMVRATELLLQERAPAGGAPVDTPDEEITARPSAQTGPDLLSRRLTTPGTPGPRTHLLSNGQYRVMVTNAGSGFSRCRDLDVTRWREDFTRDDWGQFCYIRDLRTGFLWSAGHQPVCRPTKRYEVVYSADKAEFRRVDGAIATHLEITVTPEHCAEVRRLTLTNHGRRTHELEVTTYAEVVLAPHPADLAHPAFGKLFLQTEWVASHGALLCHRRPREAPSPNGEGVWAAHVVSVEGQAASAAEFETDRARFLGRGRTPAAPAALEPGATLSGTTGPVLDPIFSVRRRIRLEAGASVSVLICTGVAGSRADALALVDHYREAHGAARAFDLAWAHSQVELRHLQITTADVHLFQRLATHLLYASPTLRAAPDVLTANRQGQPGLWRYGISGDRPILLVRIAASDELPLLRHLLLAHSYWRLKGLQADLVILSDQPASYVEELYQQIQEAVRSSHSHDLVDKPGGVFVRKTANMPEEDLVLLQAAARVVLVGRRGTLATQLSERIERLVPAGLLPESLRPARRRRKRPRGAQTPVRLPADLLFGNGWGGFRPDGREYCILPYRLPQDDGSPLQPHFPPAPWINVIANPVCGFLVSESGLGCTWAGNSQQNRLTPWSNDPVADPPAEVVYLRDEESGAVWTPTPRPLGLRAPTLVRHGQGYTSFEQRSHGLRQELRVFVAPDEPVKMLVLRVWNPGDRPRRLSATFYAEWVFGTVRSQAAMNVQTSIDEESGALLARNSFSTDFAGQVAFADVNLRPRTLTGDRTEFLGRNNSVEEPAALGRVGLSGRTGPGLDPCAAVQAAFELPPGEEREIVFFLGAAAGPGAARALLRRCKEPGRVRAAWEEVQQRWEQVLTAIQVRTPDPALDVLLNRWLPYQVLSCRVWGRSAFYQSGGAYGFRDQLQDVMALVYGAPEETRAQVLRAASRQFLEGDVQHWWHPPSPPTPLPRGERGESSSPLPPGERGRGEGGHGVRTRISDDYLWLPFVVCHYVAVTGDAAILDETVPFLSAPTLPPGREEDYGLPRQADEPGTLYEHCVRALRHGLRFGAHGLPLMGTGDWNDGMNRVGAGGKGESVWNGWFLLSCLRQFAELAEARGDREWAASCREQAERLRRAIEENAWDGAWYRRAYFDDGTPLGSAQNDECRIDSIVQSWAVISGAADPARTQQAMTAVEEHLVRREDGLIRLFTPPFDKGPLQPGYVKGYVPGIRENGGQYTHAATWVVLAAALQGRGDRAKALFDLLSPLRHTATPEQVERYRVEPYAIVGDVYGEPPHVGRGGWTWYTGSAAWLYRVAVESLLGFHRRGERLILSPCIPKEWKSYTILYRHHATTYRITVENPRGVEQGVSEVVVDGQGRPSKDILLSDEGGTHEVRVLLG